MHNSELLLGKRMKVLELERNGNTDEDGDSMAMATCTSPERWKSEFSTKQRQIFAEEPTVWFSKQPSQDSRRPYFTFRRTSSKPCLQVKENISHFFLPYLIMSNGLI